MKNSKILLFQISYNLFGTQIKFFSIVTSNHSKTGETKNLLDIINLLTSSKLDVKDVEGHEKPDRGSKWYLDNNIGL